MTDAPASAAEIVAGAMRLQDRAVLVGTRSRGKGCSQTMVPLPEGLGQLYLTTSEFRFDLDESILRRPGSDIWGVEPHEQVTIPAPRLEALLRLRARAETVPPTPRTVPASVPATGPDEALVARLTATDPQLARGLALLTNPEEMAEILSHAARKRAARKALATQRARRKR